MLKKLYWLLRIYSIRAAQALINALLLFVPAISRAGRIRLEGLSVDIRILHGKAAHHFVVLVGQNVAVIDVSREFHEMFFRYGEIGVGADEGVVGSGCPSHSEDKN